jgi:type IV pilus assembly protein PilO
MPKSFSFVPVRGKLTFASIKDPRVGVRAALGALLLLNLAAAIVLFKPWGGSAEDLEQQLAVLRQQVPQRQAALARTMALVQKVEKARAEGDTFMAKYMLNGRSTYSTIIGELDRAATQVKLTPRERQFGVEPIDGSDNLGIMTISANYEGAYPNLTKFINELDRSPRFLIIESLQASPQPVGQNVNVNFKLYAFIRDETGGLQ